MTLPFFEVIDCDLENNIAILCIRDKVTQLPRRHVCKFTFLMRVLSRYMIEQGCVAEDVRMIKRILSIDKNRHNKLSNVWTNFFKRQNELNVEYRHRVDGLGACQDKLNTDIAQSSKLIGECHKECANIKETCRINNNSISSILDRLDSIETRLDIRSGRNPQRQYYPVVSQPRFRNDEDIIRYNDDRHYRQNYWWYIILYIIATVAQTLNYWHCVLMMI